MSDMWLIDSGDLMGKIKKRVNNSLIRAWLYNIIAEVPGIDAVPVVRCKDCTEGELVAKMQSGYDHIYCHIHKEWVVPDYFCGSGERKDGDGNG